MKLGHALRDARFKRFPNKEKKQYEIAEMVGVSATYLSQVEGNKAEPSWELIKALCQVYKIPPAILFWMAMEPKDIHKKKLSAFNHVKEPMNNLIEEYFFK